jgi:glyoxylase-like metal-dependent hydrolase (beta-lactamase superfamily II)
LRKAIEQGSRSAGPDPLAWFAVRLLQPGVFLLGEPPHVNSFLIEGEDRAVLFDTGLGVADICEVAHSLTDRPVSVVNSHHHFDHVGGNHLFEETAIHESGVALLMQELPPDRPANWLAAIERVLAAYPAFAELDRKYFCLLEPSIVPRGLPADFDPATWRIKPPPPTRVLRDGDAIDLGRRRLRVLHAPGHTPDGICLLDEGSGALFAGDSLVAGPQYLHLPGSDLEAYAEALERLDREVGARVTVIYPAHVLRVAAPPDLLGRTAAAARAVLEGRTAPEPWKDPLDQPVLVHWFGDFSIATAATARSTNVPPGGAGDAES